MKLINFKLLIATSFILISSFASAQSELNDTDNEINVKTIINENTKELFYDFLEQPTAKDKNYYSILRMASNAAGQSGICSVMGTKMLQSAEEESDKFSHEVSLKLNKQTGEKQNLSLVDIKDLNIYQKIVTISKEQLLSKETVAKVYEIRKLANSVNECMNDFQELEKKKKSI